MSCLQCFMNLTTAKLTKIPWISQQIRAPPHPNLCFVNTWTWTPSLTGEFAEIPTLDTQQRFLRLLQLKSFSLQDISSATLEISYKICAFFSFVRFFTIVYQLRTRAAWIVLYTCLRVIRAVQSAVHTLFNRQDLSRELYQLSWAPYHVYLNAGLIDWDCPSLLRLVFLENY